MTTFDFDLFVVGAGSGGVRASRFAAGLGARVAVAEERHLGGTCVNVGCIPKKLMAYAAHISHEQAEAPGFGWSGEERTFNWQTLLKHKDAEIRRLNGVYANLLKHSGVQLMSSRATLADAHTVEVAGKSYTAKNILVATGARAQRVDVPGAHHTIVSDDAFHLPSLPSRPLVLGGGYIAVEFASIFNGLGSDVTLLHRGAGLLKAFDADVSEFLATSMAEHGIAIRLNDGLVSIERAGDWLECIFKNGDVQRYDCVLSATGRVPNVAGLGLEQLGIELSANGAVVVDEEFRTACPSVFAVGDCIDRMHLTPVALAEAMVVVQNLFGQCPARMDYADIATAVFCDPNVASVGLSEAAARSRGNHVRIFKSTFRPLKATLSGSGQRVFMKLVVDVDTDRVLGAHMVGPDAGETIQGIAIALKCRATKAQFDATIGIHPTLAEEFVTMRQPHS